ncbi:MULTISPECIES: 2-oxoacid:acceptor oxidoreductase family protein [Sporomusa]|jgi:2-oxoglutarate ferredoxin oxidoreductase subunit gamma|uniref:NADH-dependent phenylglyoxylate dehydrogenase subunit gamma n=2 Tax=Sporomusa TaxID=2375 RepID=A0ABM9VY45_9FIRM|nr:MULTISPECIES: 2-oxoacid:acceptor oxidoreductase family protein [Sporomusa]MCM0757061.1 2-oxoacid:acceptor oxidoreductase family protein [Sporomusa sphaeroides DSM 2875]OLS58039.1 NADH-dependent phenylglyoxylate dehydrogenase subunit gamma [Sporomusa sphaeroides DSM 2875]CVK17774.1 NADH-dependent phenylglyoxylate dehydrogenase subunit gamma [Sporomusa sphaeroides DSM 2875]SCM80583.1 2-oxoglutarate synthase subunit KorC [uncultured Sporomusa sp.]HML31373.1 2-oxoacid:acceptor oxidoreductase fa
MWQISLSGTGGQGLILAGIILAEAAILDGKQTIQTQSYGPEARGGASKSEVLISDQEIDYPKATAADILLAMSQEACNKYIGLLKQGGKLVVDTTLVKTLPEVDAKVLALPITHIARNELGNVMVANIVALGALAGFADLVELECLTKAVLARVPKGTEELNKKALETGYALGQAER